MADEQTGTETTTEAEAEAATDAAATEAVTEAPAAAAEGGDQSTVLGGEGEPAAEVVTPDAYELTAPEGITLDEETLAIATPVFKDIGLDNERAQKLMPVAAEFAKRAGAAAIAQHQLEAASAFQALNRENLENAKGDAEIGGAKWDDTVKLSAKALDMLGFPVGSEFRKFLNETGMGNHPEMIRAFRRIGERVSEDGFARGGDVPATKKSTEEILYPTMKAGE